MVYNSGYGDKYENGKSVGELIYSGKQSQKDGKSNIAGVYLKDCGVIKV